MSSSLLPPCSVYNSLGYHHKAVASALTYAIEDVHKVVIFLRINLWESIDMPATDYKDTILLHNIQTFIVQFYIFPTF